MSTRLLINERPLTVLPSLVTLVGMERAVILQQIHWLLQGRHNGELYDGCKWIWGTHDEWCADYFPFWQPATLRKHMVWLENKGLLLSAQLGGWNRRKHYRIDYEALDQALQEQLDREEPIEHDRTQCIEHGDTQCIEYDHDASMRDDHAGSMRDDHAACTIYTKTSAETSAEKRSSSSSASSSEPQKKKDDDDDLVFNGVLTAWDEGMPEKATNHIRRKLKELIAECGPDAVIGGILAAVEAGGRSFKYVATCTRNGLLPAGDPDATRRAEYAAFNHWLPPLEQAAAP
jgi:hypothetical protein